MFCKSTFSRYILWCVAITHRSWAAERSAAAPQPPQCLCRTSRQDTEDRCSLCAAWKGSEYSYYSSISAEQHDFLHTWVKDREGQTHQLYMGQLFFLMQLCCPITSVKKKKLNILYHLIKDITVVVSLPIKLNRQLNVLFPRSLWSCFTTTHKSVYFPAVSSSSSHLLCTLHCGRIECVNSILKNQLYLVCITYGMNILFVKFLVWTYHLLRISMSCGFGKECVCCMSFLLQISDAGGDRAPWRAQWP